MFNRIIAVTAVTLLLIGLAVVPALALLPIGQQAPDFQLTDLSGNVHKLSDYRGKVVVIDFFGDSCGACQQDAKNNLVPLFNTYYKNNANVQFLSIEVYGSSAAEISSTYLAATGAIPWPILTNGQSVMTSYNVGGVPTLYVVDPAGNVAATFQYPTDAQALKSTIDKFASGPAVCAQDANSLDLFAKGTDGALWYKQRSGQDWSSWQSLGGYLTSSPAATSSTSGKIDVFVRGGNGALYQRTYSNNAWGGWTSLGGVIYPGTGPAASSWGAGRLDVFVEGMNGALYHQANNGAWSGWESLSGYLTSSPAAAGSGGNRIDVFVRGGNGALYQRTYSNNAWGGWTSLGGVIYPGTGPAASSWGAGRLDVFVEGMNGALYHQANNGAWSGWESLSGYLTSSPAAASPTSGKIDVFVRGGDNGLWEKTYNGGWYGWTSAGSIA